MNAHDCFLLLSPLPCFEASMTRIFAGRYPLAAQMIGQRIAAVETAVQSDATLELFYGGCLP
jgi:hypothetical protein